MSTEAAEPFQVERLDFKEGDAELRFSGELHFDRAVALWRDVRELVFPPGQVKSLGFDLRGVTSIDGGAAALLVQLQHELIALGVDSSIRRAQGSVAAIVELYASEPSECVKPPPGGLGLFEQVGSVTVSLAREVQVALSFVGEGVLSLLAAMRDPRTVNWRDVTAIMERAGADGLPIVVLINFLIGTIMAFQGALQLKQFGADIFVADLVGLSVTRELGPLMTAIIVAGRSGAAFAAALGTMRVSEEIDALRTLGFDPIRYLVFPRALALVCMVPLLTLVADAVALLGGLFVGVTVLDLSVLGYLIETQQAMELWDVFSGVLKSGVFALAIALISCQQGLATSGGAEGVGRRTTSSVVSILFALIVIDGLFTVLFYVWEV